MHLPPPDSGGAWFFATVVKMLVIFTIYMVGVMLRHLGRAHASARSSRIAADRIASGRTGCSSRSPTA